MHWVRAMFDVFDAKKVLKLVGCVDGALRTSLSSFPTFSLADNLARLFEMQAILIALIEHFEFSPAPGNPEIVRSATSIMSPMYGLPQIPVFVMSYSRLIQGKRGAWYYTATSYRDIGDVKQLIKLSCSCNHCYFRTFTRIRDDSSKNYVYSRTKQKTRYTDGGLTPPQKQRTLQCKYCKCRSMIPLYSQLVDKTVA